ncbi:MFS transporter, partial [Rhizobium leguminosarum]|uniref:MFS transporter n=1 Tax=Rhizobium leguminosarum TaxID=384 RepID=UPI003F97770E
MLLGIAIGLRCSMPAFASLNLDPLNRFTEPALILDITPRSGPIVIQVDYEIADEDLADFMDLMGELRRIRIRDGARNWAL